jgi:hypothetical protein
MQDSSGSIHTDTSHHISALVLTGDSLAATKKKNIKKTLHADSLMQLKPAEHVLQTGAVQIDTSATYTPAEKSKQVNFFSTHELKVVHQGPQLLNHKTPDWIFPVLLLVAAAFAWLRTYYYKYFIQIASAFFNNNLTNQIVRDENILVQRASVVLNLIFNLVAALFLYFVSLHYSWSLGGMGTGFNRYIFFTLLVSAAYAMKFLILKISGYLFNLSREMSTYLFNIFLVNNILGMLLIPMVALLAFSGGFRESWIFGISLFFIGAGFLYRIGRGITIGFTSPAFSPYYLFLYLCALEFAPIAVLIKILSQQ